MLWFLLYLAYGCVFTWVGASDMITVEFKTAAGFKDRLGILGLVLLSVVGWPFWALIMAYENRQSR